jgi:hypothetical protein
MTLQLNVCCSRRLLTCLAFGVTLACDPVYGQELGPSPDDQLAAMVERITALERKVKELERSASRVRAPFEVVDDAGKGILRVEMQPDGVGLIALADPTGEDNAVLLNGHGAVEVFADGNLVAGLRSEKDGRGLVFVMNEQTRVAELTSNPEDRAVGLLSINDAGGDAAAIVEGSGYIAVLESSERLASISNVGGRGSVDVVNTSGETLATLSENFKGSGELSISGADGPVLRVAETLLASGTSGITIAGNGTSGYVVDVYGKSKQKVVSIGEATVGGGALAAYNAAGNIGAILSGTGQVHVADKGGVTLATMVAENGEGAFSVRNQGGETVVRLGDGKEGGLLQLASSTGNAMVEAGSLHGRGIVRAYPIGHPGMGMVGMPGTFISGLLDLD